LPEYKDLVLKATGSYLAPEETGASEKPSPTTTQPETHNFGRIQSFGTNVASPRHNQRHRNTEKHNFGRNKSFERDLASPRCYQRDT
jgi:hypothetical protein